MIKNIIFDLGNVLLSWKPVEFFENSGYDQETVKLIHRDVFRSSEWLSLDNGDITTPEAIEQMSAKSLLQKDFINALFNLRTKIIFPLADNIKLLPELKEQGFKLYYLSNFPLDFFDEVKKKYDFFRYFDGGLISAEVRHSKPDTRIYEILLEKFNLVPEECFYFDDIKINVSAAESVGIKGHCTFASPSISDELHNLLSTPVPES